MQISRSSFNAKPSAAKAAGGHAPSQAAPVSLAGDALSLSTPGDPQAIALCREAQALDAQGQKGAAATTYAKAIQSAGSFDTAMAIVTSVDPDAPGKFYFNRVREGALDDLVGLAKQAPIGAHKGDAAVPDYLKMASEMYKANLTPLADVFYQRALDAGTTRASFQAIQQSVAKLEDKSVLAHDYGAMAKDKIYRLDHPITWWNPLSWLEP
jgi:hypothetical protein